MNRLAGVSAGLALCLAGCLAGDQEQRFRNYNEDGVFLFQRGDYRDARESFQAALTLKPKDPALLYNLGEACERMGNDPQAEQCFRACLKETPTHPSCRHAMVELLTRTRRQPEAEALIKGWRAADPNSADSLAEEGWILLRQGDLPAAQTRFQEAVEQDPHNTFALTELAKLYETLHWPDRAVVIYERLLEANPNLSDVAAHLDSLYSQAPAGRIRGDTERVSLEFQPVPRQVASCNFGLVWRRYEVHNALLRMWSGEDRRPRRT